MVRKNTATEKAIAALPPISKPDDLSPEASAEWDRIVTQMDDVGLLTSLDQEMFRNYCEDSATLIPYLRQQVEDGNEKAEAGLHRATLRLFRFAKDLGLTPAARAAILKKTKGIERHDPKGDKAALKIAEFGAERDKAR